MWRANMAKEISRLKEEADLLKRNDSSDCTISMSPGARSSRIFALESMLATSSTALVAMASQLSEAEERERVFGGKGRWNHIRSLPDAKNLMNHLFNLASSSRCLLRDKEVACRETDMEIRDLKEKVVRLSCSLRQMETQKDELVHRLKLQSAFLKQYPEYEGDSGGRKYDLRKPENRRSTIFYLEDMDISDMDSDSCDVDETDDDDWVESGKLRIRKRNSKIGRSSMENIQSSDEASNIRGNSGETEICCSCTKSSSCKTAKCKCRSMGNTCGRSCGCLETKCANRASISNEEPAQLEVTENGINGTEKHLATQGAELLKSALIKSAETNSDHGPRKPLSDIGNTAKSNAPKPNHRKKWRKSTIQLVSDPPPPSQSENSEVPIKQNNNTSEENAPLNSRPNIPSSRPENAAVAPKVESGFMEETDISTLKIPRAMRKAASSNSGVPLWDRNAGKPEESVTKKEPDVDTRSPVRQKRTMEKENHGR